MTAPLLFLAGVTVGLVAGFGAGFWLNRERLARAQEKLSYAARELDRRKHGATRTDLRALRRGLP